jgi:hypothetical protein
MNVPDLKAGEDDDLGARIEGFYARNPPYYAVYRTRERVAVQYADDPDTRAAQRKAFTQVNPLRGEINGLVDGWRIARGLFKAQLRQKAQRYDRRVGDALAVAFEDDVAGSVVLLTLIKQEAVNERTAWARLEYVAVSLGIGLLAIGGLAIAIANKDWGSSSTPAWTCCTPPSPGRWGPSSRSPWRSRTAPFCRTSSAWPTGPTPGCAW